MDRSEEVFQKMLTMAQGTNDSICGCNPDPCLNLRIVLTVLLSLHSSAILEMLALGEGLHSPSALAHNVCS